MFIPAMFSAIGTAAGATAATAAATGAMVVGAGAAIVGTGISAYGMIQQGKTTAAQMELQSRIAQDDANYQAKLDENNAVRAGYAAIQEQQQADREIDSLRETRLRTLGSQRAALGKSGLTISGSAVDVMTDTSLQIEKEIQLARYRGQVGAYNYATQASDLRTGAAAKRIAGRNIGITSAYGAASARYNAAWSATGAAIGGLSQASMGYASFKRT